MSAGYFGDRSKSELDGLLKGLITANHILHHYGVLDALGQISVRNPDTENTFFMAHNVGPALISSKDDIIEFGVDDASPVKADVKVGFSERYLHSEIYKKFAGVNSIVLSHASDVLPYSVNDVPLRPIIHLAGFLGTDVPVWDINSAYSSSDKRDLLVRSPQLGSSLASSFAKASTVAGSVYSTISSKLKGAALDNPSEPFHPVVLLRGHGYVVTGRGIEEAVYQSIYTQENAKSQTTALLLKDALSESRLEGKVDVEGGGKIKDGKVTTNRDLHYLSAKEASDAWSTVQHGMQRSWRSWVRVAERNPLYENALGSSGT